MKVNEKVRATQIGTASKGVGCGNFNVPALYGSVKKSFNWIRDTVVKEMGNEGVCSLKKNMQPDQGMDYASLPTDQNVHKTTSTTRLGGTDSNKTDNTRVPDKELDGDWKGWIVET